MEPSIISRASSTSLRYARNDVGLNVDRPFENELCRAGECNVVELIAIPFKANLQFVTATRENRDRPLAAFSRTEDERARDYSRATRERFVFHPAFIRADGDFIGSAFLDEVYVCAIR